MGKKAAPKLAMEAKNHMENHVIFSFFGVLGMVVSIFGVNFRFFRCVLEQTAKLYKLFYSAC